jgi:hypothetical protein
VADPSAWSFAISTPATMTMTISYYLRRRMSVAACHRQAPANIEFFTTPFARVKTSVTR